MTVWFNPNHIIEFFDVGTVFRAEFEDCLMTEFIAVSDSL